MDSLANPSPAVFRYRAYSLFWAGRVLTTLAVQAESVTIGWQVYTVARRTNGVEQGAFLVGMVGLAQFLPLFALTFVAGAIADRQDRRTIILVCLAAELVCVLALALLALHPGPSLAPIFAIAALFGASRAFLSPAQGAMGPMLVPREVLPRAIAWNSLGYQSASIIGPWIGGALCAVSPTTAYVGSALLYLAAGGSLLALRADTRPSGSGGSRLELIREGIHYVWTNKIVLGAISLDLFAVLLGGATALLPVYARDVLKIGAHGFGVLRSGPAIGAALMAVALSRWQIHRHAGRWMFAGVAAFGVATLVFAVSKLLWVSVVALAALGAADMISVYVRNTLVQIVTPDAMRGRVSAVSGLFIGASNELGEFETGVVARVIGPVGAALFGGFGSLGVTGLWSRLFPALRDADRLDGPEPALKSYETSMIPRYDFASDNTAGAAPEALEALVQANAGYTSGYGTDTVSKEAADAVRALLDTDADVRFVASGTAANAIACAALCRPFESVLSHRHAHIQTDETGAPGFFGHGLGLIGLDGASGRIDPSSLASALEAPEASYRQSPAALSLTNATEYGTVYSAEAIGALAAQAKSRGLPVHLDGARLANAIATGFDVKALKSLGVDILVMGGTKAGMPLSEAVVLFDRALSRRFDARLKQAGQLPSKGRFLATPWIGMLRGHAQREDAWTTRAAHANAMARKLAASTPFPVAHPVEANGVFVEMDEPALQRLRALGWNVYRFTDGTVRFMCSWATTPEAVEEIGEALRSVA